MFLKKIDQFVSELSKKDDSIKAKDELIERLKTDSEQAKALLKKQIDYLEDCLKRLSLSERALGETCYTEYMKKRQDSPHYSPPTRSTRYPTWLKVLAGSGLILGFGGMVALLFIPGLTVSTASFFGFLMLWIALKKGEQVYSQSI